MLRMISESSLGGMTFDPGVTPCWGTLGTGRVFAHPACKKWEPVVPVTVGTTPIGSKELGHLSLFRTLRTPYPGALCVLGPGYRRFLNERLKADANARLFNLCRGDQLDPSVEMDSGEEVTEMYSAESAPRNNAKPLVAQRLGLAATNRTMGKSSGWLCRTSGCWHSRDTHHTLHERSVTDAQCVCGGSTYSETGVRMIFHGKNK